MRFTYARCAVRNFGLETVAIDISIIMRNSDINWDRCTNKDEMLSQYTEEDIMRLTPYGCQPEPDLFRFVKFGDIYATIDEDIADVIIKLNKHGYITKYCCSGHYYNGKTSHSNYYISFENSKQNIDLIDRINNKILIDPNNPKIKESITYNGCGIPSAIIKEAFKLNNDAKKHLSKFFVLYNLPAIYFHWIKKSDIDWINNLILSVI